MEIFQPSWRGRSINSRKDSNGRKYTAMVGPKSLLYIPVNILPNAVYKVTLELCRESGNGIIYCNLYGNRNYDFHHSKILCENGNWTTFDVDVITKDFPKTVPMVFRIWRGSEGSGSILVRKIIVQLEEGPVDNINTIGKVISIDGFGPKSPNPAEYKQPPQRPAQKMVKNPKIEKKERAKQAKEEIKVPKRKKNKPVTLPTRIDVATPPPKILPVVIGEDGIKVSILISIYNRIGFFRRTLETYIKQTLPKKEFEIVIIDDKSKDNILGLCKQFSREYRLQFKYILIDNQKGAIKPASFVPALSNNIGLKHSRGSVTVITGPETLIKEDNLKISWEMANKGYCVYGDVFRSSEKFVNEVKKINIKYMDFDNILEIPGAKADPSVTFGWWWYYIAVRKEHILAINGVDEKFMKGITGEDDDFALRMSFSGVPLIREHRIVGIHQDHTRNDKNDLHSFRYDKREWKRLRTINTNFLHEWIKYKNPVANEHIDWGSENAIIKVETF